MRSVGELSRFGGGQVPSRDRGEGAYRWDMGTRAPVLRVL